jgi:uncharacterized protein
MVFIGGWRSRRRGYGPYGGGPGGGGPYGGGPGGGYGYGRGYGGGRSCLRDLLLVEGGCCLAELLGCGPQLLLVAPSALRRALTAPHPPSAPGPAGRTAAPRPARERLVGLLLDAIRLYQTQISPKRRPCCRYSPTCSHYAATALQVHGLRRGGWLAVRRLLRCRPGAHGGADPVPSAAGAEQVVGERPRL